jgi:ABC-type iron transport system FetAB ATPase subunit
METTLHPAEYDAVRHILAAPKVAARTYPYLRRDDFDWEGLRQEAETMSGGERLLVSIAYELWHAEKVIGLWEIPRRLDAGNFRRVVEALSICRGSAAEQLMESLRGDRAGELAA